MALDPTRLSTYYGLIEKYTIPSVMAETTINEKRHMELHISLVGKCEDDILCAVRSEEVRRVLSENPELASKLSEMIARHGAVFVRSDKASPKDVCAMLSTFSYEDMVAVGAHPVPGTMGNACIFTRVEAAVATLLLSERVAVLGGMDVVWGRRPAMLEDEVRVFVKDGAPRLISWYYPEEPPRANELKIVVSIVEKRYLAELLPIIDSVLSAEGLRDYVVDLAMWEARPIVVELSPFPSRELMQTDPILYRGDFWEALKRAEEEDAVIFRYPKPVEDEPQEYLFKR